MVNNTVKGNKTGKAAGKDDPTILVSIDAIKKTNKELEMNEDIELEATGIVKQSILDNLIKEGDYVSIKVYKNTELDKKAREAKNGKENKSTDKANEK